MVWCGVVVCGAFQFSPEENLEERALQLSYTAGHWAVTLASPPSSPHTTGCWGASQSCCNMSVTTLLWCSVVVLQCYSVTVWCGVVWCAGTRLAGLGGTSD